MFDSRPGGGSSSGRPNISPAQQREKRKHDSPMSPVHLFFLHAVIIIILMWILFGLVIGLTTAPNGDMFPRIDSGDLLLYFRLENNIKAQDVVVLRKNDTEYVGRVVAVGGDTVDITDGEALIINGNAVSESNIFYPTPRYEGYVDYPAELSEGEYFILTDKRSGGEDSRFYGKVRREDIVGTVITIIRRNNI